ncbi:FkbM family methyltransferase [Pedobacter sp. MC2016-24]|uniref:FkbM family methyltransferase n=1 Tax=Pedobacter sp. MC2016-24 TaxID=2780090 RepID=UPI001D161077|nr:FkbM family methyltransferase [Pedobacter sp. MC2016-24]
MLKRVLSPYTLLNPDKLKVILSLGFKGYLAEKGWFKAFETKSSVDFNGDPIPWVTYSFIDFIKERITKQHDVFEFGSGNSTLFYSKYANHVSAVEHDQEWYEKCKNTNLNNADLIYCALETGGEYCKSANTTGKKFHLIIVDGRDRVNCCKQAIQALTADGVIVLDDSERPKYQEAIHFLKEKGFKHIAFTGMAPGVIYAKSTSIFYKPANSMDI